MTQSVLTRFQSKNSRIRAGETYIYVPCMSDKNSISPYKAQLVLATGKPFYFSPVNGHERCEISSLEGNPLGIVSTCGLIRNSESARAFYLNEAES